MVNVHFRGYGVKGEFGRRRCVKGVYGWRRCVKGVYGRRRRVYGELQDYSRLLYGQCPL